MSAVPMMLADTTADEAKSLVASAVTQILNIVRTVIAYVMEVMRRFTQWAGEHPLGAILMITNITIWIS